MTQSRLYTILLDYRGGTYIAQVSSGSTADVLPKWLSGIRDEELAAWGITRGELKPVVDTDDLIAVNGCLGVWCTTGSAKNGLILINVIATDGTL